MIRTQVFVKIAVATMTTIIFVACSPKKSASTSISIVLPSANKSSGSSKNKIMQNPSALSFDFTVACFAVNVVGGGLAEQARSCGPKVGVFSGFVDPTSHPVIEMKMDTGTNRRLEVYLFNRASSSDVCPADFSSATPEKFVLIGSQDGIDMSGPTTDVSITVSPPAVGTNLVTQLNLPATCSASASTNVSNGRVVLGAKRATGGGYTLEGQVTAIRTQNELTGSGYKMYLGPKGL